MPRRMDEVRPGSDGKGTAPPLGRDTADRWATRGTTSNPGSDEYRSPRVVSYPSKRLLEVLGAAQS